MIEQLKIHYLAKRLDSTLRNTLAMSDGISRFAQSLTPIASVSSEGPPMCPANLPVADESYRQFLNLCNGGYTPDGFYHFFGGCGPERHNVMEWNKPELWKDCFGLDDSFFAFAENIFGDQFGFVRSRRVGLIKMLSIRTGELTRAPDTFSRFVEFAESSESRAELDTLANQFFATTRTARKEFSSISYNIPPCLGGDPMDFQNWDYVDSIVNLRMAGQVLTQVKDLKPGTKIRSIEVDEATQSIRLIV